MIRSVVAAWLLPLAAAVLLRAEPPVGGPVAASQRQVTIFGVIAVPHAEILDARLVQIESQLRKFKPDHGFRLRGVATKTLSKGETLTCDLGGGVVAEVTLLDPINDNGKLRLRFLLRVDGKEQYRTAVTTPANQLFFCEKPLEGETQLLIGVGAR